MDHKHAILSPAMAPPGKHAIQPINCSFPLFPASRSYITPMAANPPPPFLLTSPAPEARQEDPVGRLGRLAAAGSPLPDPPTLAPFPFRSHTTKSGDRTSQERAHAHAQCLPPKQRRSLGSASSRTQKILYRSSRPRTGLENAHSTPRVQCVRSRPVRLRRADSSSRLSAT